MNSENRSRKSKIAVAGASLFLLVGMSGCVSEGEARRQREEAHKNGVKAGQLEERNRCNAQIESINAEHQVTINQLENEKTALYWAGFGSGVAGSAAVVGLLVLVIGGATAFCFKTKRGKDLSNEFEQNFKRPPPRSVTEEI